MIFITLIMIILLIILWISICSVFRISSTREKVEYSIYGSFFTICAAILAIKAINLI